MTDCAHETFTTYVNSDGKHQFCDACPAWQGESRIWFQSARPKCRRVAQRKPKAKAASDAPDLGAVTRVGAEFRAFIASIDKPEGSNAFAFDLVRFSCPEALRLVAAASELTEDQRVLALALCEALAK